MAKDLVEVTDRLGAAVGRLRFSDPVAFVYNPLEYAWPVAKAYLERFGRGPKEALLLGMNPGPFGMAQTGVPFGQIAAVQTYLKLAGDVGAPKKTHAKKPVTGFDCTRSEVSGERLWGAIAERHPDAKTFFARAFVTNYCPLLFLDHKGANLTPDKLVKSERAKVEAICDEALAETVRILQPRHLIGIGLYAAKCLERVTGKTVDVIPHPSPASPKANRGWAAAARAALADAAIEGIL